MRQSQHPYCAKGSGPHDGLHQTCLALPRQPSPADSHPPQHRLIPPTAPHPGGHAQRADPERAPITPSHTPSHSIPPSTQHTTPQRSAMQRSAMQHTTPQRSCGRNANTAYGRGGRDALPAVLRQSVRHAACLSAGEMLAAVPVPGCETDAGR
ncbi:MAG: hypothetical protein WDW38_005959 [Sanguina aurantia]